MIGQFKHDEPRISNAGYCTFDASSDKQFEQKEAVTIFKGTAFWRTQHWRYEVKKSVKLAFRISVEENGIFEATQLF